MLGAWDNPEQQLRVERITRRIVANSDRRDLVFNVTVLASMEVNACALPGGFMFVNRGLLEKVDDNQLAFVIAHELSHVTLRHSTAKSNLQAATKAVAGLQGAPAGGGGDRRCHYWYAHGLQAVVHQGKLVELPINEPSSLTMASSASARHHRRHL